MKKTSIFTLAVLLFGLTLASCESYFDVDLDNQATLDEIFSQKTTSKQYLQHIYSYIPMEEEIVGSEGWVVPRSDEGLYSFTNYVYYNYYKTGNYSSATPDMGGTNYKLYYNFWYKYYQAISQCTIFLNNIDKNKEDTPEVIQYMKAEARFLRAYYYFCLFRQYGPVFLWYDQLGTSTTNGATIDRHTVEQNIDFIVGELDAIKNDLPLKVGDIEAEDAYMARVTRGAALALKSRVLLYAASPLYNGCDLYKGKMKNMRGEFLFPQTKDENKWQEAADAAWAVIQMNQYKLCERTAENTAGLTADEVKFRNAAASYQAVVFDNWNEETIWGWWRRTTAGGYDWTGTHGIIQALPPFDGINPATKSKYSEKISPMATGYAGIAPSLKLIDSYPMWTSGRYPIEGYQGNNDQSRPKVDPQSGYEADGWVENYKQPIDADWAPAFKAHKSCVGRDPRFYSCLVPNGFYWPNKAANTRFTGYMGPDCTSPFDPAKSGTLRVGYIWRRMYKADKSMLTLLELQAMKYVYPAFRMAEIYLNYAEACNEKPERDAKSAVEYLNKVRNRSGLNNIEEAYPGIEGDQAKLRWCIQKERMVEFGMECQRHYDACRWMIAKDEYPGRPWTLNMLATTYEDSYKRINTLFGAQEFRFIDKDYLFPISANVQAEMVNMTQNYGH